MIIFKAIFNTIRPINIEPIKSAYLRIGNLLENCNRTVIIITAIDEIRSVLDYLSFYLPCALLGYLLLLI